MAAHNPTWMYEFSYRRSFFDVFAGQHGLELPFLFDTLLEFSFLSGLIQPYRERDREAAQPLITEIQTYFANFAKYGDPNLSTELQEWPKHQGKYRMRFSKASNVREQ